MSPIALLGYAASLLIIISVSRTSILQLRIFGLVGSLTFLVYAVVIGAFPVALTNLVLAGLHLYFLSRLWSRKQEFFTALHLTKHSQYLRHFLEFHRDDIVAHQPGFEFDARDDQIRAFVLRDTVPTGVFIGRACADGSVEVELDYVVPQYRDMKVANYLYSPKSGIFADDAGSRTIWTRVGNEAHVAYFKRLGFDEVVVDGRPALAMELADLMQ